MIWFKSTDWHYDSRDSIAKRDTKTWLDREAAKDDEWEFPIELSTIASEISTNLLSWWLMTAPDYQSNKGIKNWAASWSWYGSKSLKSFEQNWIRRSIHKGTCTEGKAIKTRKSFNGLLFEPTKAENGEANRLLARGERRWKANTHCVDAKCSPFFTVSWFFVRRLRSNLNISWLFSIQFAAGPEKIITDFS